MQTEFGWLRIPRCVLLKAVMKLQISLEREYLQYGLMNIILRLNRRTDTHFCDSLV
jgi:hypothetical protein